MNSKKIVTLAAWIICLQLAGYLIGLLTRSQLDGWYTDIIRSPLTPPAIVFSIVWPLLYVLIAVAGWHLWQNRHTKALTVAIFCYFTQLLLNWLWTPLFFSYHLTAIAALCILLTIIFTAMTIIKTRKTLNVVALLLLPYLIWLLFAFYLNCYIVINNRLYSLYP